MDYEDLKKEIYTLRKSISSCRKQKTELEKELTDISLQRKKLEENFSSERIKKEQQEKERYKKQQIKPLEAQKASLEDELQTAKQDYEVAKEGLTVDNLMEQCSDEQSILAEVKEASDNLRALVVEVLGERFCNELESQLTSPTKIDDTEKLQDLVMYFNSCEMEISNISKNSGKITRFVNKIQNVIGGINVDKLRTNSNADYVVVGLVLVLTAIGFKYVYPIYLTALGAGVVLNLVRHYKILKTLLVQKTVRDNVQNIEEMLRAQVLEDLDNQIATIDKEYELEKTRISLDLEKVEGLISQTTLMAENSFKFDDMEVRHNHSLEMTSFDQREDSLNERLGKLEAEIVQNTKLLNDKNKMLDAQLMKMQESYLNPDKIGDSFEFDVKFLQNVKDNKLEFFEHPEASCLLLYDDYQNVMQFIRLILLQLRVRMSPFAFNVDIYDPTTIGRELIRFKPQNPKKSPAIDLLFRIFTKEAAFKEEIDGYKEELEKRVNVILREYKDIKDYNKFMLSIDSLAETYKFIFLINPSNSLLGEQDLCQQLTVGGSLGIYTHVFISEETFLQSKQESISLLNSIPKYYSLDKNGAKSKSKTFLMEKLEPGFSS